MEIRIIHILFDEIFRALHSVEKAKVPSIYWKIFREINLQSDLLVVNVDITQFLPKVKFRSFHTVNRSLWIYCLSFKLVTWLFWSVIKNFVSICTCRRPRLNLSVQHAHNPLNLNVSLSSWWNWHYKYFTEIAEIRNLTFRSRTNLEFFRNLIYEDILKLTYPQLFYKISVFNSAMFELESTGFWALLGLIFCSSIPTWCLWS